MKTILAVLVLTLTGCASYVDANGKSWPALAPLPSGSGPIYGGGPASNATAYQTVGTVRINGVSRGYSVTTMGK